MYILDLYIRIVYTLSEYNNTLLQFEWDENKRQQNIDKHGIDFIDTQELFNGSPFILQSPQDHNEERFIALGKINNDLPVAIIFTLRNKKVRIISARKAREAERKLIK